MLSAHQDFNSNSKLGKTWSAVCGHPALVVLNNYNMMKTPPVGRTPPATTTTVRRAREPASSGFVCWVTFFSSHQASGEFHVSSQSVLPSLHELRGFVVSFRQQPLACWGTPGDPARKIPFSSFGYLRMSRKCAYSTGVFTKCFFLNRGLHPGPLFGRHVPLSRWRAGRPGRTRGAAEVPVLYNFLGPDW